MSGNRKRAKQGGPGHERMSVDTSNHAATSSSAAESRRVKRVLAERKARRNRLLLKIGGAASIAVLAVVALIVINNARDDNTISALVVPTPSAIQVPTDGRTKGDPDAPVTIVEWADYQCPACGAFARDYAPQFVSEYVATGKVLLEYRDMAFLGDESRDAAKAAVCGEQQDAFWDFHSMLYANQGEHKNTGSFSRSRLNEMAVALGLNEDEFGACMVNDATAAEVQSMYNEALAQGITSTPTFIIDGTRITGTNYAGIREAIEAALAGQ